MNTTWQGSSMQVSILWSNYRIDVFLLNNLRATYHDQLVLHSLMVLPAFQRHGIGTKLVRYCLDTLEMDQMPVWLTTQMRVLNYYLKFGWEEVDAFETDLSKYTGPLLGYGLHKSPCMIRPADGSATQPST